MEPRKNIMIHTFQKHIMIWLDYLKYYTCSCKEHSTEVTHTNILVVKIFTMSFHKKTVSTNAFLGWSVRQNIQFLRCNWYTGQLPGQLEQVTNPKSLRNPFNQFPYEKYHLIWVILIKNATMINLKKWQYHEILVRFK